VALVDGKSVVRREGVAVVTLANVVSQRAAQESDAEVLARLAAGDMSALGLIYDRHAASVLRFATRAAGHRQDAEDITHATFVKVAAIAHGYDGRASCRPWLFGIAARILSHRRRSIGRFARFLLAHAWFAAADAHDPCDALDARSELTELEHALSALSDAKRVVLILFEVESLSGEEIAQALSIPVGTVWTRLYAARRELRNALEARS
jgi:RNA polymerase sigma-70 factor (ECF subfamily)